MLVETTIAHPSFFLVFFFSRVIDRSFPRACTPPHFPPRRPSSASLLLIPARQMQSSNLSSEAESADAPLMLHRHALESIFASLSFKELRSALRVSKRWLAAVYSMRGIEEGHILRLKGGLDSLPTSRLARHVSLLDSSRSLLLGPKELRLVSSRIPFLRELHFIPLADADWSKVQQLPATLVEVSVRGTEKPVTGGDITAAFTLLSTHPPLEVLRAWFRNAPHAASGVSFAPLRARPTSSSCTLAMKMMTCS